jgi:hypothetical protein
MVVVLPAIGMGNSPPARKLAVSPDCAVRFGSARMVMRLSTASASITPLLFHLEEAKPPPSELADGAPQITDPNGSSGISSCSAGLDAIGSVQTLLRRCDNAGAERTEREGALACAEGDHLPWRR